MVEKVEMTHQEKYDMYMSLEKESLVEMLIECNRHLYRLTPKVSGVKLPYSEKIY